MMRKFPKLLAVVLAIAIIICPAMCLTSMAETANDYSISYENDVVTVNVTSATGFLVALLRLDVKGFTVDEEGIAVATTPAIEFAANPDFDAEAGTLSLLLAAKDAANIDLVNAATVTIPVTQTATDDYGITLTTIQAADKGSEVEGEFIAESFLAFPNVADAEDGAIDLDAAGDKVVAVAPCAHANTSESVVDATCEADGSVTVTCGDCGATVSTDVIPALGHDAGDYDYNADYHWNVCNNDASHELNKEAHDYTNGDCVCGKEAPAATCSHANWTKWEITQPTKTETGLKTRVCADCGEATEEVVIPAAQLDSSMIFRTPQVTIGETLGLRLRARTSVLKDTTATYAFVATPQKYNGTTLNEETGVTVEYAVVKSGTNYIVDIPDIAVTELGLDVNAYIVRYNAEGIFEAYGNVEAANPAAVLKGMVTEGAASGSKEYKLNVMIGDLLALGAAAQDYFPTSGNALKSDLYTSERVNLGVEKWASVDLGALNVVDTNVNTVWNPASVVTSATNRLSMEVGLNPAPAPTFVVRNATATGSNPLDYSKLSMTISYTSTNDGKTRTETYEGDEWNALVSRNHLKAKFPKVAMYDSDQVITAVLTYDGVEVFTSTYTIETYFDTNKANASAGVICTCAAKFGISARAYFNA